MVAARRWYRVFLFVIIAIVIMSIMYAQMKMEEVMWPWEVSSVEEEAMSGNSYAVKKLYYHYLSLRSEDEANGWLRKGADLGMADIQYMYATVLNSTNPEKAACWYGRSAIGGYHDSTYNIALYFYGKGDLEEYKKWLVVSANQGNIHAGLDFADSIGNSESATLKDKRYAYYLYMNAIDKTKAGSVFNQRAKEGAEKLGIESDGLDLNKMNFGESEISNEMQNSVDNICNKIN